MKELILIFTLCGANSHVVVHDTGGWLVGHPSTSSYEEKQIILRLLNDEDSQKGTIPLEEVLGLRCT